MIRKLLITLTVVLGTIGVGWGAETTKLTKADNICFANGNPITITESTTAGSVTITVTGTKETVTIASTGTVYGGSKNAEAASSTITMESGTIANIYGGGLGEGNTTSGTPANIKGNTSITIKGGTVSNLLVGGGHFYSKSNDVTINISGSTTKLASVISGGYDAGKTTNSLATTLGNSVNGVKSVTLNMTGGEITEGLGCGGGNGFSYTGMSVITLNGVKLAAFYGVLSNGRADNIKATVTNCTFAKNGDWYEFASVNRGTAANIDFTFDGCTFNNLDQINASLGPVNGWADSDTDGKVIPCVTGKTKFVFTNTKGEAPVMQVGQGLETADIELTGAKAKIDKFVKKNPSETITAFTIGAGKTWTFNNGLEIAKEVTLTQTGTLVVNYSVANAEQLVAAVAAAPADAIIQLAAGTYTLDKQLIVDKPIVLIGAGKDQTTIKGQICITATNSAAVKFDKLAIEGTANIIEIGTEKTGKETPIVTLTNCKVKSTEASGIRLLSVGAQLELKNTDIDAYYYGIGVRNEKQKITVDGGIITGWAALMTSAGGLATGDGTLANTETVIDIKNGATLKGRSISNEEYGVIALQEKFNGVTLHIEGSTVIATDKTGKEGLTTAIKQLSALDIRSYGNRVTVTNSTLSALHSENALNAAIVSLGWHSADFGEGTIGQLTPKDLSIPTQNTITINGTLTNKAGEKYVTTYRKANNQKFDGLTINGTSYSVEAGNVCRTYQSITGDVTVDDNGNPIATNNEAFLKAIANVQDGGTVSLGSDITLANSDSQYGLAINKKITLDGNGHTITAAEGFVGYMITVGKEGSALDGIQIKNLTLNNNKKAKGLNIYASKNVVLTNVTSKDGLGAGVVVNNSTVTANGLYTSGNAWGGVNVDKGTPENLVFKFDATSTFAEVNKVWSEITDQDAIVSAPDGWRNFIALDEENKKNMRYWTTQKTTSTTEVANDKELVFAIKAAQKGETILLTAATYGTEAAPALMGEVKVDNVTIKAKDGLNAKPKVYGTIWVKAEGCTINGLEMLTKSNGAPALKNIINVFAMSATITNNVFNIQAPTLNNVTNAVCIWPYGVAEKTAYVISGNTFNNLQGQAGIWCSTALQLSEGFSLSSFGYTAGEMSKVVTLANEKELLTANTFKNCDLDYAHADWTVGTKANAAGTKPYYSFTGNSNVGAFKDAVAYSATKAYIEASFITEKQALAVLNTKDAIAHNNAVPDSIVINCKDAYLVTGEKEAIAFAATERDKAVFWLKRAADHTFSTVAVGNNWRIINGNTTWNDAANVNRSVEIKAGAKLTINVAMALDSVRMDEGAELITALPVTAKTLQATYTVAANKWKPFAFPVSGMTVKDAKDDKTVTPIVQNATTGVWFAGLSATTAPTFAHTTAFAQAGIIAANVETEILVASTAAPVSLITKSEPTAPTDATAKFLFVANPNLFAMTLTQTAYVLNEAGTAFERRDGAVIKPFQSYVLADARTTATLRSLRVDGVVTKNEIIPTEGYYVESAQGAIVIHTAESVVVEVVDMTGRIVYKAQETMDGCRIALPAGIYAVNRQMVIVK